MVKAEDLIKEQKKREDHKSVTYEKIYIRVEKKINLSSSGNFYYTWYVIPEFLVGLPLYSFIDCKNYIIKKLKKNGFCCQYIEPNILLITWYPNN